MKIILSKKNWEAMGRKAGWKEDFDRIHLEEVERHQEDLKRPILAEVINVKRLLGDLENLLREANASIKQKVEDANIVNKVREIEGNMLKIKRTLARGWNLKF